MMTSMKTVVLVEDDSAHAHLIMRGFKQLGLREEIRRFNDGSDALDYLKQCARETPANGSTALPALILLDLRLPTIDGWTVLKKLKACRELSSVPVAILSTSDTAEDKSRAEESGADGYFTKPWGFDKLCRMLEEMHARWLA